METIGKRAYKEIKKRAKQNGIAPYKEAEKLVLTSTRLSMWKDNTNPSAYYLQQMVFAGYDVIYILTGEKKNEN